MKDAPMRLNRRLNLPRQIEGLKVHEADDGFGECIIIRALCFLGYIGVGISSRWQADLFEHDKLPSSALNLVKLRARPSNRRCRFKHVRKVRMGIGEHPITKKEQLLVVSVYRFRGCNRLLRRLTDVLYCA